MPDHSNEETRKTEQRLGPFLFDADEEERDVEVL